MDIVEMKITDIIPYENNPRRNDEAVDKVALSISSFGFKVPIIVDKNNVIVAGHTRLKAAEKLGLTTVPTIRADDLTDDQIKAFRLADNKVSEFAEWDFEALEKELDSIEMDMSLFGFEDESEDEMPEVVEDDFNEEPPADTQIKVGDIFQLGEHRLMCGDSTDPDNFAILMGGAKADMVFTDPPYGVAIGSKNETLNSVQKAGRCTENIKGDTLSEEELYDVLKRAFINIKASCAEDAVYYVTSPQGGSLGLMMMMMKDAGLEVRHVLMWKKNCATFSLGRLDYDYQHEPIFYTWGDKHHNFRGGEYRTTVWEYDKPRKCDIHPTMKPVELVVNAILDGTQEGMKVLDGFGGSGTTIIACEQTNRACYMMELDPHYVEVIIQRWETFTGQKAVKLS